MDLHEKRVVISENRRSWRALGSTWLWILVPTVVALAGPIARAQDCALEVTIKVKKDTKDSKVAYQRRDNRCEGTYDQPVANRINLRIVGFHLDSPVFDPLKADLVRILVKGHQANRKTLLKVVSTRRHQYFQMDTSSIADDSSFSWPMNVVREMREPLQPYDTAVLACVSECAGDRSKRATLLPVSFSSAAANRPEPAPTLIALVDVELARLTATLRKGDDVLFEERAVGGSYLAPHKPIRIPLEGVGPGEVLLSLSAVTQGNQRDYLEALLVIPERN